IALAEIKGQKVLQHQEEALVRRLVEAELLLKGLDELRVEALGAAVLRGHRIDLRAALHLAARAEVAALPRARDSRARPGVGARKLRDDALDRPTRRELHDHERHQQDAEQGRNHEQDAADNIGGHRMSVLSLTPGTAPRLAFTRDLGEQSI